MGLNILTLGSSKTYTDESLIGLGSLKGAPCTIKSITEVDGGQKVTFEWTGTSGTKQTSEMTVKNGISVTGVSDKGNGVFTLLFSDGSESDPIQCVKGEDGVSPTATVEKVGKIATITITDKNGTTTATIKDGEGSEGGEANTIDSISVNGVNVSPDENKNVDITVPSIDGLAKTEDIPTKVSELTNDSGYLTEHQDISGKVDKVDGKSLIADTEIARLASVDNYDDTQVKTAIQAVANGLMDSVGYSADYKTIDIIAKNGVKKSVNVAPIISHASITELSDVDTTNKATGKALVYNATTSKHEYTDVSGTDEKVKMDASTDAKYLGELLDNVTIANENGELKVKKLDGQEVTITEINYLKGLTMNVMDLVNMFSNGGVKIINTPVATYAELLTLDKSSFIEGISYLVYVLADENHDNAKTTYLVDKDSETPTYFGFADSQRDFTTNPIDLATEITGKLGISNMDSDAIKALFTVDDTYKTETATNNAFSTHGAKALYDELLIAIGNKANDSDLTAHKDDTDIHVSTEDRTKWDSAKTHADSAHAPSNAQENVLETVKVNNQEITPDENKAVNIDLSDYAKKTDIPTTLPASGGNADTVNNHTVKSNVPIDAVFTDTLYDDTSVKSSISALQTQLGSHTVKKDVPADAVFTDTNTWRDVTTSLTSTATDVSLAASAGKNLQDQITTVNSNLVQLSYDDSNGGKNLLNPSSMTFNSAMTKYFNHPPKLEVGKHYRLSAKSSDGTSLDASWIEFNWRDSSGTSVQKSSTKFFNDGFTATSNMVNALSLSVYSNYIGDIVFQIEEGYKITDYEPYIPSVKMLADEVKAQNESLSVIGKCKNLLNPTLQTTTQNGVTCTNNGDGTYTVSGTNSTSKNITFIFSIPHNGKGKGKLVGCPQTSDAMLQTYYNGSWGYSNTWDKGNGSVLDKMELLTSLSILVYPGKTVNLTFKPMLTTNLNATYDDFVPYTGDGETLTHDVAEIKNNLNELKISDIAGGKNLFGGLPFAEVLNSISKESVIDKNAKTVTFNRYADENNNVIFDNFKQNTQYTIILHGNLKTSGRNTSINFVYTDGTFETISIKNTTEEDILWSSNSSKSIKSLELGWYENDNVILYYDKCGIFEGVHTVNDFEPYIPSVKMLADEISAQNDSLSVIGKCKNLLNPTLRTTTQNGVKCTNNGDGTYTLNGTATDNSFFKVCSVSLKKNIKYKNVTSPKGGSEDTYLSYFSTNGESFTYDFGEGKEFSFSGDRPNTDFYICIKSGYVCDNLVFKPMITTNLSATYDDFVPYTGDGDTLTHDVADLKNNLGGLTFSASGTTLSITDGTNTWTLEANS